MSNNIQKDYNEEIRLFLSETDFPAESIPENMKTIRDFSLSFETPKSLNISNANFRELLNKADDSTYKLHEMLAVITAAENRTYAKYLKYYFEIPTEEATAGYTQFLEILENLTKVFNGIVKPKQESLKRKYETLNHIKHGTPAGKSIHLGQA